MSDFNDICFDQIIADIVDERIRQDTKFGHHRDLTPIEWLPILVEEVGEFAQEICESSDYPGNMRAELIQIAALAIAITQDLDSQIEEDDTW